MKIISRYVVTPLFFAITGCATQSSLDIVRNDVDAVKTRLFSVEKDLGGVREESKESLGSVQQGFKTDVAAVRKISADIQATVDSNKNEMQAMNGRIDDIAIAVKKPAEDLARYREDADRRLMALEDRVIKLQIAVDDLNNKFAKVTAPQATEQAVTPDSVYMKGLETFKAGDMPAAREIFTKFLDKYPQNDLAANAEYWIGETYYSEKNYDQAILTFQDVIKNHPQKEKAPAAMLKQAMAFKAIKDSKNAKFVLKKLVESYPKSAEVKKAKELLEEMK